MTTRELKNVIPSIAASDGAGVKLRRSLGAAEALRHDPFLMLDEFFSDDPDDYLAGFPAHPHRGFETVTYMLDGHMQHKDNHGNTGDLGPGDVQWMSAASGIIHSEMPQQSEGRMRGFQLWLNLPAKEKMKPAAYRDISANDIPVLVLNEKTTIKVIAGKVNETVGPITGGSTDPYYWDVRLEPGADFSAALPEGHNAFVYAYEGEVLVGDAGKPVPHRAAGLLSPGSSVKLRTEGGARVLVLAGKPLREPVVQYGPFVMNTRAEIEQAIADYQAGRFSKDKIRQIALTR
jgi:redox-sensitive bicupin YhaK (pirin superfamily)